MNAFMSDFLIAYGNGVCMSSALVACCAWQCASVLSL